MVESYKKIIDISPTISDRIAVFPGDTEFFRKTNLSFEAGDKLRLSSIETTVHVGAHADAPSHYHPDGVAIQDVPLDVYYGTCQVMEVKGCASGGRVSKEHLSDEVCAPRLLLKTLSFPDPDKWTDNFVGLSPELVAHCAHAGVRLIGVDTPSVDSANDKELLAHAAVYEYGMAILEGVVLDGVTPGTYTLAAFPLKVEGADGAPVRAVLIEGECS